MKFTIVNAIACTMMLLQQKKQGVDTLPLRNRDPPSNPSQSRTHITNCLDVNQVCSASDIMMEYICGTVNFQPVMMQDVQLLCILLCQTVFSGHCWMLTIDFFQQERSRLVRNRLQVLFQHDIAFFNISIVASGSE